MDPEFSVSDVNHQLTHAFLNDDIAKARDAIKLGADPRTLLTLPSGYQLPLIKAALTSKTEWIKLFMGDDDQVKLAEHPNLKFVSVNEVIEGEDLLHACANRGNCVVNNKSPQFQFEYLMSKGAEPFKEHQSESFFKDLLSNATCFDFPFTISSIPVYKFVDARTEALVTALEKHYPDQKFDQDVLLESLYSQNTTLENYVYKHASEDAFQAHYTDSSSVPAKPLLFYALEHNRRDVAMKLIEDDKVSQEQIQFVARDGTNLGTSFARFLAKPHTYPQQDAGLFNEDIHTLAKLCADHHVDLNLRDAQGAPPMDHLVNDAATNNSWAAFPRASYDLLSQYGAKLGVDLEDGKQTCYDETLLFTAVHLKRYDLLYKLYEMQKNGVIHLDFTQIDKCNCNLMQYVCKQDNPDYRMVTLLADISPGLLEQSQSNTLQYYSPYQSKSPLNIALEKDNMSLAYRLVALDANPVAKDSGGCIPIGCQIRNPEFVDYALQTFDKRHPSHYKQIHEAAPSLVTYALGYITVENNKSSFNALQSISHLLNYNSQFEFRTETDECGEETVIDSKTKLATLLKGMEDNVNHELTKPGKTQKQRAEYYSQLNLIQEVRDKMVERIVLNEKEEDKNMTLALKAAQRERGILAQTEFTNIKDDIFYQSSPTLPKLSSKIPTLH